jgi:hypothetical protein
MTDAEKLKKIGEVLEKVWDKDADKHERDPQLALEEIARTVDADRDWWSKQEPPYMPDWTGR